ncbi:MAG: hypothetical protein FJY10_02440 [Bacteroidetes bacterium]|nr:hypothetical protein [Bacteroidota bacterium]
MLIYRFKVVSEDPDDLVREVEIYPNQTFLDFQDILLMTLGLGKPKDASFFVHDKQNKVHKEVVFANEHREERVYDEDLDEMVMRKKVFPLMKKATLKSFIEDPHQRLNYIYNTDVDYHFFIELLKITNGEGNLTYPRISKSIGQLLKKTPKIKPIISPDISKVVPIAQLSKDDLALLEAEDASADDIAEIERSFADMFVKDKPKVSGNTSKNKTPDPLSNQPKDHHDLELEPELEPEPEPEQEPLDDYFEEEEMISDEDRVDIDPISDELSDDD